MANLTLPFYHNCYSIERDPETPWWAMIFLVASNFVFIIPSIKAYRVREYFASIIFLAVALWSPLYHLCKPLEGWCLLPYSLLYSYDFFTAFMNVPLVLHWFLPFRRPLIEKKSPSSIDLEDGHNPQPAKRSNNNNGKMKVINILPEKKPIYTINNKLVNKDIILFVIYGFVIALIIGLDMVNIYGYLILVGVSLTAFASVYTYVVLRFKQHPPLRYKYMIVAVAFLALGAFSFMIQPFLLGFLASTPNPLQSYAIVYGIIHSIWHALSALAQFFFIQMRLYIHPDDEVARINKVPIDKSTFEHEVEIFKKIHNTYQNPVYVREKLRLRRQQEVSPWTFYLDEHYDYNPSSVLPTDQTL